MERQTSDHPGTQWDREEVQRSTQHTCETSVYLCLSHKYNTGHCLFSTIHWLVFWFSSQLRCFASLPSLSGPAADDMEEVNMPHTVLAPWVPGDPGPSTGLNHLPIPRHRSGLVLTLRLFVTENYEERRSGPCVITAGHRVYVEVRL